MNTITMDTVRDLIERHSDHISGNTREFYNGAYAEIADELNSRVERTCEWELEHSGTLYDKWRCSKCGYLFVEPRCDQGYTDLEPNYCPNCGRKVEA